MWTTDENVNPFWDELGKFLHESIIVDERRHVEVTYLPLAICISDLIRQIKKVTRANQVSIRILGEAAVLAYKSIL